MNSDRGSKKWVSLMIPEHQQALAEIFTEEPQQPRPADEQALEEMDRLIQQAALFDVPVTITWQSQSTPLQQLTGIVINHPCCQQTLTLMPASGKKRIIPAGDMITVKLARSFDVTNLHG